MSKPEKHGTKKRPVKLNVGHSTKPSEYKRVAKLLEQKGMELAVQEAHQHDLFEAVALALGGPPDLGKTLLGRCQGRLRQWVGSGVCPKGFEYLADVRPFLDFYESFPGNILFEGLNLNILATELACKIRLYSTMDDNCLLVHTDFNFPGQATLNLLAAKQDEFTFYYPMRLKGDHPAEVPLPSPAWKEWKDAPDSESGQAGGQPGKSLDQFLAEFDFSLVGFANSFSVYKYRYSGNFPEEVRLKLIAADLKSRLHAVSASTQAGKQMSRRFTFYDIAKLENLDLESKKALLFGKKIVDSVPPSAPQPLPQAPSTRSYADLSPAQEAPEAEPREANGAGVPEVPPASAHKPSDKRLTEVYHSAEKSDHQPLKREDFLLVSPPSGLTKGPSPRRFHGTIKVFFDEEKYGFLESEDYGQDVYVSLDELKKAGVTKKTVRKNRGQVYSFAVHEYHRKHKLARKAVEIKMEEPN